MLSQRMNIRINYENRFIRQNSTLNAALGVKSRAQVIQEILTKGGELVAAEDEESQKYFKTLKSAFLDLARQKGGSST